MRKVPVSRVSSRPLTRAAPPDRVMKEAPLHEECRMWKTGRISTSGILRPRCIFQQPANLLTNARSRDRQEAGADCSLTVREPARSPRCRRGTAGTRRSGRGARKAQHGLVRLPARAVVLLCGRPLARRGDAACHPGFHSWESPRPCDPRQRACGSPLARGGRSDRAGHSRQQAHGPPHSPRPTYSGVFKCLAPVLSCALFRRASSPWCRHCSLGTCRRARRAHRHRPRQSSQCVRLETDAAAEPLGIDSRAPRLSWALVSGRRGVLQATYRVLVASRADLAREGAADVWDSGDITSPDPFVLYRGPALASRTRGTSGRCASPPTRRPTRGQPESWFETAKLVRPTGAASGSPGPNVAGRSARPRAAPTMRRSARRESSAGPSGG